MRHRFGETVKFDGYQDFVAIQQPTQPRVQSAFSWFQFLKKQHGHVAKSQVAISEIATFIDQVWLLERTDNRDFVVRLYSTGTTDLTGDDLTGITVDPKGDFEKWIPLYHKVLDNDEPVLVQNKLSRDGLVYLATEVGMFPLVDRHKALRYVLGVFDVMHLDARAHKEQSLTDT